MSKQYLLMVEESDLALLCQVLPALKAVEAEVMEMKDIPKYKVIVTPVPEKIEPACE